MRDCLAVDGNNTVPLSHIGKERLRRLGLLPTSLSIPADYMNRGFRFLAENEADDSSSDESIFGNPIFGGPRP